MSASELSTSGGALIGPPPGYTEALGHAKYKALRIGTLLAIQASGTLSGFNQIPDIRQSLIKIFPPQFNFYVYTPEITVPALRPFSIVRFFGYPKDVDTVVIHDADGSHRIPIVTVPELEPVAAAKKLGTRTAEGHGHSLQEAFDNAVAQLPNDTDVADGFAIYTLIKTGFVTGGIIGISLYYAVVEVTFSP